MAEHSREKLKESRRPVVWLILAGTTAAALSAWLIRPTSTSPTSSIATSSEPGASRRPPASPSILPPPLARATDAPPQPDIHYSEASLPSAETATAKRLPRVTPNPSLAAGGVHALLPDFQCDAPFTRVEQGHRGLGEVGCGVLDRDGGLIRLGRWVRRSPGGRLEAGTYEDGRKIGVWETYSERGTLLEQGHYEEDAREGAWETYSEQGEHIAHREYSKGYLHGISLLYHEARPIAEVWDMGRLVASRILFGTNPEEIAQQTIREAALSTALQPAAGHAQGSNADAAQTPESSVVGSNER